MQEERREGAGYAQRPHVLGRDVDCVDFVNEAVMRSSNTL